VKTLPEAVQLSLDVQVFPHSKDPGFDFARVLKAFEVTTGCKLSRKELEHAFSLWWASAEAKLPAGSNRDESRLLFLDAFQRVRAPHGSNPLAEAIRRADAGLAPEAAGRYPSSLALQRLVAVCYHLQRLSDDAPFFLSARGAAKLTRADSARTGLAYLNGLVSDGVLALVAKGTPGGKKASRYRYTAGEGSPRPT
jgi:hypothetical protein